MHQWSPVMCIYRESFFQYYTFMVKILIIQNTLVEMLSSWVDIAGFIYQICPLVLLQFFFIYPDCIFLCAVSEVVFK